MGIYSQTAEQNVIVKIDQAVGNSIVIKVPAQHLPASSRDCEFFVDEDGRISFDVLIGKPYETMVSELVTNMQAAVTAEGSTMVVSVAGTATQNFEVKTIQEITPYLGLKFAESDIDAPQVVSLAEFHCQNAEDDNYGKYLINGVTSNNQKALIVEKLISGNTQSINLFAFSQSGSSSTQDNGVLYRIADLEWTISEQEPEVSLDEWWEAAKDGWIQSDGMDTYIEVSEAIAQLAATGHTYTIGH